MEAFSSLDEDSDLEEQHSQGEQEQEGAEDPGNVHITIIRQQTNNIAHHGDFHLLHGTEQWEESNDDDETVSDEEAACGKVVDANGNGRVDPAEKRAFIACLKGTRGGYDGPDADSAVSAEELRSGCRATRTTTARSPPRRCLGIRVRNDSQ